MSIQSELSRLAKQAVTDARARTPHHEQRISDLVAQLAEEKLALETANLAQERLANYPITRGRDYLCPICWIERKESVFHPIGDGTDAYDVCEVGHEIEVPI